MLLIVITNFGNLFGGPLSLNMFLGSSTFSWTSLNVISYKLGLLTELEGDNSSSPPKGWIPKLDENFHMKLYVTNFQIWEIAS